MTGNTKAGSSTERRGGDIVYFEELTAHQLLRRYLYIGSWVGLAVFIAYGTWAGFSYGGFGGIQFFTDMWLVDSLGNLAPIIGAVLGVFIAIISVWAMCVIFGAIFGALIYWFKYKSFPIPQDDDH